MTALLATLAAPALFAQSTLNTTAPGPSQETKPGQTNNNLQNPGSNMQRPADQSGTYQEHGTVEGTASESATGTNSMNNQTGTSTGTTGTTGTTTGTMNNDSTTGTTTTGTGSYNGSSSTGTGTSTTDTTSTSTTSSTSLPRTASELPTVAIAGLLALAAFFAVRLYSKRNA
jgi:cobalamin biosynthesis Mg chelatase CobN